MTTKSSHTSLLMTHDERVDYIVTEKRLIECAGTGVEKDA